MSRGSKISSLAAIVLLILAVPVIAGDRESESTVDREPATRSAEQASPFVFRHAKMISINDLSGYDLAPSSAMRAFIDPVTGELRAPSNEELAEIEATVSASAASTTAPIEIVLPNGAIAVELGPEWLNHSIASISADGVAFGCVEGDGHNAVVSGPEEE